MLARGKAWTFYNIVGNKWEIVHEFARINRSGMKGMTGMKEGNTDDTDRQDQQDGLSTNYTNYTNEWSVDEQMNGGVTVKSWEGVAASKPRPSLSLCVTMPLRV